MKTEKTGRPQQKYLSILKRAVRVGLILKSITEKGVEGNEQREPWVFGGNNLELNDPEVGTVFVVFTK